MKLNSILFAATFALASTHAAFANFVTPRMGGGQQSAPMVMPNVLFDGTNLSITGVLDMRGNPISVTPVLRPLTPPDAFDPARPWSVLTGTAYNLQYGWNLDGGSAFLPAGGNIFIQEVSSTPGLLSYERVTYAPIFGTAGSSDTWLWDGVMAHNAYAVPEGIVGNWTASYRLYIGDGAGTALPGYGQAFITLDWTSIPEPASLGLIVAAGAAMLGRRR